MFLMGCLNASFVFAIFIGVCSYGGYSTPWFYSLLLLPLYPLLFDALRACIKSNCSWLRVLITVMCVLALYTAGSYLTGALGKDSARALSADAMLAKITAAQSYAYKRFPASTNYWIPRTVVLEPLGYWEHEAPTSSFILATAPGVVQRAEKQGFKTLTEFPPELSNSRLWDRKYIPIVYVGETVAIAPGIIACKCAHQSGPVDGAGGWRVYMCLGSRLILLFDTLTYVS